MRAWMFFGARLRVHPDFPVMSSTALCVCVCEHRSRSQSHAPPRRGRRRYPKVGCGFAVHPPFVDWVPNGVAL